MKLATKLSVESLKTQLMPEGYVKNVLSAFEIAPATYYDREIGRSVVHGDNYVLTFSIAEGMYKGQTTSLKLMIESSNPKFIGLVNYSRRALVAFMNAINVSELDDTDVLLDKPFWGFIKKVENKENPNFDRNEISQFRPISFVPQEDQLMGASAGAMVQRPQVQVSAPRVAVAQPQQAYRPVAAMPEARMPMQQAPVQVAPQQPVMRQPQVIQPVSRPMAPVGGPGNHGPFKTMAQIQGQQASPMPASVQTGVPQQQGPAMQPPVQVAPQEAYVPSAQPAWDRGGAVGEPGEKFEEHEDDIPF
jgi:hypothetical protein